MTTKLTAAPTADAVPNAPDSPMSLLTAESRMAAGMAQNPGARAESTSFTPGHTLWRSAGFSHPGHVRRRNEDAWLSVPDQGLWLVADGMGGHDQGDYASQAIVDALSRMDRPETLDAFVNQVRTHLFEVNRELHERARQLGEQTCIGSTVVALLAHGMRCACVWAGDSRLYLMRGGNLFQVTQDHTLERRWLEQGHCPEEVAQRPKRHALTQAVGVGPGLQLEMRTFSVESGDMLLLCSDGLYRELEPEEVSILLGLASPEYAATALQAHGLGRPARDNLTAVVVAVG